MQKLSVLVFGTASLGLTTLGLLVYVFRPQTRTSLSQSAMRSLGMTLLAFGLVTFSSPTFFGHFDGYIPFGDTLLFIEGGIVATLLSLELPVFGTSSKERNLRYLAALLATQSKKLLTSTRPIKTP
jgi:hypothetical protein